jgi:hypothetical protein
MSGLRFYGGRGRLPQRQGKRESRAAARTVSGDDLALMRFDDCTANRKAEPDARRRRFAIAAREFLKNRFLPS